MSLKNISYKLKLFIKEELKEMNYDSCSRLSWLFDKEINQYYFVLIKKEKNEIKVKIKEVESLEDNIYDLISEM